MKPIPYFKPVLIGALLLALVLIAQNTAPVQARVFVFTIEVPLILLLALTTGAGFLIGLMAPALWRPRRTWPRPVAASAGVEDPAQPHTRTAGPQRTP